MNENVSQDLHPLGFPGLIQDAGSSCGCVAHHRDTHLTTDVINSHMHKDGSLFYAFQVHVSVTWNRGSRAGTGLGQVTGGAAGDFRFVSSRRGQAGFSQLLLTVSVQAQASPCHTQVHEPHHLQTSPPFLSWFYKTAMSCFIQGLLLLLSIHDLNLATFSPLDLQSIIKTANLSSKVSLLRLDVCFQS